MPPTAETALNVPSRETAKWQGGGAGGKVTRRNDADNNNVQLLTTLQLIKYFCQLSIMKKILGVLK